jgi:hypothetical protein
MTKERLIMNWKDVEGCGYALIKLMHRNLPGETEEKFEKSQSG